MHIVSGFLGDIRIFHIVDMDLFNDYLSKVIKHLFS